MVILNYDILDSTNLEAKRLVEMNGINEKTIIIAKNQTNGRGRLDRTWLSIEGNYMFSCVFLKSWAKMELLPACVSIAIYDCISNNDDIFFKWPNDLLIVENSIPKKFAGVLIEACKDYFIVGIGINVVSNPNDESVIFKSTNLKKHNLKIESETKIFENILSLLNKPKEHIFQLWSKKNFFKNKIVTINNQSGLFIDIDDSFNVILEKSQHKTIINYGDISFAKNI